MRALNARYVGSGLLLVALPAISLAQRVTPTPSCALSPEIGTYPTPPLTYPKTSDRYAVQYQVNGGPWTDTRVYISYYGGTNSSPFLDFSGYSSDTSMSFASIPVQANSSVELRVSKIWSTPFQAGDRVSVRPSVKGIAADLQADGTVQITRNTSADFAGEQFILWWSRGTDGGSVEALAFFLDPPYSRPAGSNVKVVASPGDLAGDLSAFDTLDVEGVVAISSTGAKAFSVPTNITNIFLGPGAWLQGKLHFLQSGLGQQRRVYGPGVLDVSRFEYDLRFCDSTSSYVDQGYGAISLEPVAAGAKPDKFIVDGIVIADHNLFATDLLSNSTLNNVKTLGWNGNNDGFELGINTTVSNVFVRSGDDSLKMWRPSVTIRNATIWQDFNGGVVNLGWYSDSPGDGGLIDGLYVVKTDWHVPTNPSWTWSGLADQNNGVFVSLMVPGTSFGSMQPPVFRNIFVEDPPQVLFSLKILPPRCTKGGLAAACPPVNMMDPAVLNLRIENLFSPPSVVQNSIGFETLPAGYNENGLNLTSPYTLAGAMNISLANVNIASPGGTMTLLTGANAASVGKLSTNGKQVNLQFSVSGPPSLDAGSLHNGATDQPNVVPGSWAQVKGEDLAGATRIWLDSDFTDGNNLPTTLSGVQVKVNNLPAAVYYISSGQVDFQIPSGVTGTANVQVLRDGVASNTISGPAVANAPGLFSYSVGGKTYPAAVYANSTIVVGDPALSGAAVRKAQVGDRISLYATALQSSPAGVIIDSVAGVSGVTATVGNSAATVEFAGLVAVGEYQINIVVPNLPPGEYPVAIRFAGQSSQGGVVIPVQ